MLWLRTGHEGTLHGIIVCGRFAWSQLVNCLYELPRRQPIARFLTAPGPHVFVQLDHCPVTHSPLPTGHGLKQLSMSTGRWSTGHLAPSTSAPAENLIDFGSNFENLYWPISQWTRRVWMPFVPQGPEHSDHPLVRHVPLKATGWSFAHYNTFVEATAMSFRVLYLLQWTWTSDDVAT